MFATVIDLMHKVVLATHTESNYINIFIINAAKTLQEAKNRGKNQHILPELSVEMASQRDTFIQLFSTASNYVLNEWIGRTNQW